MLVEVEAGHCPLILIILSYFLLVDLMILFQVEVVVPTSLPNLVEGQEGQNCLIQKVHFLALEVELDLEHPPVEDQVEEVLLAEVDRNSKVAYSTMILNFLMLGMLDHYYLNY